MLTKPQSQVLPGVSQPTSSFSISSCPLLEPRLAWGSVGGWSCSLDREEVNGPQASGSAYSYACNFLLSPFFPSSFPRFPPRRPPPHPSPSIGRGMGGGVARRQVRMKSPAANPPAHFCASLEPRWKHTCEFGQVQPAKQRGRSLRLQRQGPRWGLQRAGAWLTAESYSH